MKQSFPYSLEIIFKHEGGFVNHPSDPGGATNMGITLNTLRRWRQNQGAAQPGVQDVKRLSKAEAAQIYKAYYWDKVKGDGLPGGIDLSTFDFGVNAGPSRSVKYLQRILKVVPDGVVGPVTIKAAFRLDPEVVCRSFAKSRMSYYKSLRIYSTFGRGWKRRTHETLNAALKLITDSEKRRQKRLNVLEPLYAHWSIEKLDAYIRNNR